MAPASLTRNGSDRIHEGQDQLESQQIGTFTRWWNSYLEPRGYPVTDLCTQIQDGVIAFRMLEALEELPPAPVHRGKIRATIGGANMVIEATPTLKVQRADNLNQFVKVVTAEKGIHLVNIGGEDLEAGKHDLVLGLTWELIKFYEGLGSHKMVGDSISSDLLEWVRKEAAGVNVAKGAVAWTSSFKDGQVFAAIMNKAHPEIFGDKRDYEAVRAMPDIDRVNLCFKVAEAQLDVPKLLEASAVVAGESDTLSMTTYVAKLRKAIMESEEEKAVRRAKAEAVASARTEEKAAAEKLTAEMATTKAQAETERVKSQDVGGSNQQSAETTASMAEVAAAVQATADAASTESPVDVPAGWTTETIILDKKELSTKIGLTLLYLVEEMHPFVYEVDMGGTAATPACQLKGKLQAGDRILALEAANHVVHVNTKLMVPDKLNADTLALLTKCVGHVKLGIVRDGVEMVISIDKQTKEQRLGLSVGTDSKHSHPFVGEVENDGACVGKIKVGDTLVFIEAATDVAQLQTRYAPDNIKHRVTTTFLKAVVGHIKITVHRIVDDTQREARNAAWHQEFKTAEDSHATTDTAPVFAQTVEGLRQSQCSFALFMDHLTTDADVAVDVTDAATLAK